MRREKFAQHLVFHTSRLNSNHVGYLNNDTDIEGKVARGACFATVGATKTFTLGDLKVTGYGDEGCGGKFVLQKLELDGSALSENCYYWWDNSSHPAGWYNRTGKTKIDETKPFPQGQAFWTDGKGYKLVSTGQVTTDTIYCETDELGKVAVAQATPVSLKLKDLTVEGYGDEGCGGKFVVQKLELDGSALTENCYYWWDNSSHPAGWYNRTGKTPINAENIDAPSGEAYWIDGKGYSLVLPKVTIK